MTPLMLAKLLACRAKLEEELQQYETPKAKAAIARTKRARKGNLAHQQGLSSNMANMLDRVLYEAGHSGVKRWKRKEKKA